MEANELRVGNYVDTEDGVFMVAEIHKKDIIMMNDLFWARDFVKPIPLTEEWLLKFNVLFGFNHCGSCYDIEWALEGYDLRLNYDVGMSKYIGNIKHVHQLQNLYYALTNEELTIKN
jgi:hypothetical protein